MADLIRPLDVISNNFQRLTYGNSQQDIVVFSHLRWEFVKQRPQHLLSRFAKDRKVLFVEEPIEWSEENYGTAKEIKVEQNITVLQPRIKDADWNSLAEILEQYCSQSEMSLPILWFYSPSFVEMNNYLESSAIVFDCMDELSAFQGASPTLIDQEKQLLRLADVVFTGGKSLYDAKKSHHANIHCFPSSVDRRHFVKAVNKDKLSKPKDLANLTRSVAGFYGVIDERLDLDLLAKVADLTPDVDLVIIGPVVKIDPAELPQRENIHYLGAKKYEQLPQYLAHFDVAIMPFALNRATKFISPTKTLEFMAALKPIVSTPIYDVKRDYQAEVAIANHAEEFSRAIRAALTETKQQLIQRQQLQQAVIEKTSWSKTAAKMKRIIQKAIKQKALQRLQLQAVTDKSTKPFSDLAVNLGYSL